MKPYRIDTTNGPSEEQLELLRKCRLRIGTPVFGGTPQIEYVTSLLRLERFCAQWGLSVDMDYIPSESLIQRARNTLANGFLNETDRTHLLFIDADIEFQPEYPFELLLTELDVIGAAYPRKAIDWNRVLTAALLGVPAELLGHCGGQHVLGDSHNKELSVNRVNPQEVDYVPTGFLMVSRGAFETYKAAYPDEWYWQPRYKKTDPLVKTHEFFPVVINKRTRVLESEDYCFTRRISELGVKTYFAPWIDLAHIGRHKFDACLFCANGQRIHSLEPKK